MMEGRERRSTSCLKQKNSCNYGIRDPALEGGIHILLTKKSPNASSCMVRNLVIMGLPLPLLFSFAKRDIVISIRLYVSFKRKDLSKCD